MPIFEYVCRSCHQAFETLVQGGQRPVCPACSSSDLDKQLSVFAVNAKEGVPARSDARPCGACGDPRGPGACSLD
jgi:putative FmdB family regulatory protein